MASTSIWELGDLCTPWCVHVVATLRVAEHLARGTESIAGLAQAVGAVKLVFNYVKGRETAPAKTQEVAIEVVGD